jgi:hypothetical protein
MSLNSHATKGFTMNREVIDRRSAPGISVSDMGQALIDNIKQLILIPLAVCAAIYGLTTALPKTYTSVTVLNSKNSADPKLSSSGSVTSADVLLRTARVLDDVIAKFPIYGDNLEKQRATLNRQITISKMRLDPGVTLSVVSNTPDSAKALSLALLSAWLELLKPVGMEVKKTQGKIAAIEIDQDTLDSHIKDFLQDTTNRDSAVALVTLYSQQRANVRELLELKASLRGPQLEDVILSGPTQPFVGSNKYWFLAPLAGFLTHALIAAYVLWGAFLLGRKRDSQSAIRSGGHQKI